ncbi:hypothetical protein [Nocardiopsis trehalosi]|uniref:hypothetical protein n=1 Tax=Nocardiopsis trehalosi TaxID=109329 RepID=UPI00083453B8|nr:hypothetical protein [Nocardiopsis trehalosi]
MDDVFAWVGAARFRDVVAPGYIERDCAPPEFRPWGDTVALAADEGYLRLDSVDSHGRLRVGVAAELTVPDPIREEGLEFAVASQGDQFLFDASSAYACGRVRYVTDAESDPAEGIVRCAEFTFNGRHTVFADPEWHFGILLGRAGAYEHWWNHHHAEDGHRFTERTWRRP